MNPDFPSGFHSVWENVLSWLTQHEPLLIFLAIFFEESGIPMPLPADIAMALAGLRVAQGRMSFWDAFLIGQVATLAGSSILYWAGRRGGRALLFRYGKLLHLNAHRIAQMERLVLRLGPFAVIIGRQIPGLRLAAPFACGVFRIPYRQFVPAMFVGSSVYIGIFMALGHWGGPAVLNALRSGAVPVRFLVFTALLVVVGVILRELARRAREVVAPAYRLTASRHRSLEAALLSGLGASAILALTVAWLLELVGLVTQGPVERALLRFIETGPLATAALANVTPQRLILTGLLATVFVQAMMHLGWAIVYAFFFERRLRGGAGLRGLQFAVVPWLFSGLVVFPLLDAGWLGLGLGAGPLPMLGELVRHALFGTTLGTLYRLIRLSRQPRLHHGHRHGHRHPLPPRALALPSQNGAHRPASAQQRSDTDPLRRMDTASLPKYVPEGNEELRTKN